MAASAADYYTHLEAIISSYGGTVEMDGANGKLQKQLQQW